IPLKPAGGGMVLLTLRDGTPVLVAGRAGAGNIAVWGSTCDREWTDVPVRPVFVPFLRGLVDFLGSRSKGAVAGIEAGRPILFRVQAHRAGEVVQVRSPSGTETTLRLELPEKGESSPAIPSSRAGVGGGFALAGFTDTHQAGFYEIRRPDGRELVAANVPASESVLEPLSDAELRARLPGLDVAVREIRAGDSLPGGSIEGRVDLGIYLFLILMAALVFEGALADRS
ncbi:hypothetical protein ACFLQ0_04975, partial [Nitrospinota bacterium]